MKFSRKPILWILFLAVVAAGGYYYYAKQYLPAQAAPEPSMQTAKVRTGDILVVTNGVGNLFPAEQVELSFRSGGVLAEVNVSLGDRVNAGDLLARLDDTAALQQLETAEENLQALLSPASVLEAEMAVYNAQKGLDEAIDRLAALISPAVWQAEQDLAAAAVNLASLEEKAAGEATSSELEEAKEALEIARANLESAQTTYTEEYLPAVFTISEVDPLTKVRQEVLQTPTENEIGQARLSVTIAEQKLQEARIYLAVLQGNDLTDEDLATGSGASLNKLEQARQAAENARLNLENTRLIAPLSGTVTKLNAVTGQTTGSGPLITLATLDQPLVRFFVDETELGMVAVGKRVQVTLDAYPDHSLDGEVIRIEPTLATVDGSPALAAWASLQPDPELTLLPGMTADVEVFAGEAYGVLQVPIAALRELAPGSYAVFIVQPDGQLKATPVKVGLMDYTNAEILSGLQAGEIVSTGNVETR
ncbi:MAG: efflux RND transporter periplasmic adaptor subunit [Anaerolineales bacterium]|jgi:HlyD family secretion protein